MNTDRLRRLESKAQRKVAALGGPATAFFTTGAFDGFDASFHKLVRQLGVRFVVGLVRLLGAARPAWQ